jgi:hypothetical protein
MIKMSVAFGLVVLACLTLQSAQAEPERDGAIIRNSGSTNISGYIVEVWSDGSASSVLIQRTGAVLTSPVSGRVSTDLTRKFFEDVRAAKAAGRLGTESCMKSASFGSTTVVEYHGWTSPDLTCPGDGMVVALASEANAITSALAVQGHTYRRIPMLPNEHRRPEGATASPEPSPSAS